ncbi:MAG: RNA 2',3'-cyclic phosphodiesterase [Desulfobacterales bacterium]|jgi:2'-5' RNA ligase
MTETFRAFIAIDLPESVKSFLSEAQEALKLYGFGVKWVRPQNIHLTLKFLGNIATADTDKIAEALTLAARNCPVVSLAAKGIGVFPNPRRPRVIWAGLKGQVEILENLQQTLDAHLSELGFARETRAFKSHLTLGRVKGKIAPARMKAAIEKLKEFESESFEINQVTLFKSDLQPTGAVYTKVQAIDFQGQSQKG